MSTPLPQAATVILLRDNTHGRLECLLLQRQAKASFLPNAWVFPGGITEAQDSKSTHSAWQTAQQTAARETLEETKLALAAHTLVPFSRWLAPKEAEKRFDTYFFIADSQQTSIELQEEEISHYQWLSPSDAIAQHQSNALHIIPPTLVSLCMLSRFTNSAQAIAHFSANTPFLFQPKVVFQQHDTYMLYHGDVAYESENLALTGHKHRCQFIDGAWHYFN